jgi:pimeloyl-ACP methyl ester carboxylesterase
MAVAEATSVLKPINGVDYSRPLILFLPGLSGNLSQWDLVVPIVADLPVDLAYGAAILPHPALGPGRPTVTSVASAIAAQLRKDGRTNVAVASHSVGSFVALGLAHLAPDIVRSVILVNGGLTTVAKFLDRPVREMAADPRTCLNALRLFLLVGAPTPKVAKRALARSEWSSRAALGSLVSETALETREQRDSLMAEAGCPSAMRALWDNRHHWREFASYAGQIETPVLFLAGGADPVGSAPDTRAMAAMLPHAEMRILSGIGHAAPLESASAIAAAITESYLGSTQNPET